MSLEDSTGTESTPDRSELEDRVQTALDQVEEETADSREEPEIKDEAETESTEQETESENAEVETEEAAEGEESQDETPKPTLPAAYRRSLKAYDWTDEEIDQAAKNPNFLATAAKIHANRNKELASWAETGRQARTQNSTQSTSQFEVMKRFDTAELKKKYGDDALIDELTTPVNGVIEQINKIVPFLQQSQQATQQQQMEVLSKRIEDFFGSKDLEAYGELYGKSGTLIPEHTAARNKVLETADALIAGRKFQGQNLSFEDAMNLAHDMVSGDFKTQAARKDLKKTIEKRGKSITLKPGGARKATNAVKPGNRDSLVTATKSRLAAIFKD